MTFKLKIDIISTNLFMLKNVHQMKEYNFIITWQNAMIFKKQANHPQISNITEIFFEKSLRRIRGINYISKQKIKKVQISNSLVSNLCNE